MGPGELQEELGMTQKVDLVVLAGLSPLLSELLAVQIKMRWMPASSKQVSLVGH